MKRASGCARFSAGLLLLVLVSPAEASAAGCPTEADFEKGVTFSGGVGELSLTVRNFTPAERAVLALVTDKPEADYRVLETSDGRLGNHSGSMAFRLNGLIETFSTGHRHINQTSYDGPVPLPFGLTIGEPVDLGFTVRVPRPVLDEHMTYFLRFAHDALGGLGKGTLELRVLGGFRLGIAECHFDAFLIRKVWDWTFPEVKTEVEYEFFVPAWRGWYAMVTVGSRRLIKEGVFTRFSVKEATGEQP